MTQNSFRSGAAARALGLSQYGLRRLYAAGLIQGEVSRSGQLRIPESEIARLRRDGVPPIPAPDEEDRRITRPPEQDRNRSSHWPSRQPARDRVQESRDDLEVVQNTVLRRQAELELAAAEAELERELQREDDLRAERDEARRLQLVAAEKSRAREEWERQRSLAFTSGLPSHLPLNLTQRLEAGFSNLLAQSDPGTPDEVFCKRLQAMMASVFEPWLRQIQIEEVIEATVDRLPAAARGLSRRSDWELRAAAAAKSRVGALPENACIEEIELAARAAVEEVGREFTHTRSCETIMATFNLPGANAAERADAADLVRRALDGLDIGASERKLRVAADAALEPVRQVIRQRQDLELRQHVLNQAQYRLPLTMPLLFRRKALEVARLAVAGAAPFTDKVELEALRDEAIAAFLAAYERIWAEG